ncbi:MAG: hypothetical protein ACK4WH_15610, partial [Phycisphaerales bacterium]
MTTPQPKPDLSETSPMDSKARADAERDLRLEGLSPKANGAHAPGDYSGRGSDPAPTARNGGGEPSLDAPPSTAGASSSRAKTKGGTNI